MLFLKKFSKLLMYTGVVIFGVVSALFTGGKSSSQSTQLFADRSSFGGDGRVYADVPPAPTGDAAGDAIVPPPAGDTTGDAGDATAPPAGDAASSGTNTSTGTGGSGCGDGDGDGGGG